MSVASTRRITIMLACAVACVWLVVPALASAQDYDLNFTLPTAGKSGCMVCHGDPNLGRLEGTQWVSYWVDGAVLDESSHAAIMCTGCHLDFAYKAPHNIEEVDWIATARLSCKNCHQDQWDEYSLGAHSIAVLPGEEITEDDRAKPFCGDCHQPSHSIQTITDDPVEQARMHADGYGICGQCHEEEWDSYQDYYHGAAYQDGSGDAPSCWDCHGYHEVLPSSDRRSPVHESNLQETCGQCHEDPDASYVEYAGLVHRREEVRADNPLYQLLDGTRETIKGIFGTIGSWFT